MSEAAQARFNTHVNEHFEGTRDYIVTHYKTNSRSDTEYWRANAANLNLSEPLKQLFNLWMSGNSIAPPVRKQTLGRGYPVFSWYSIMAGMGIFPDPNALHPPRRRRRPTESRKSTICSSAAPRTTGITGRCSTTFRRVAPGKPCRSISGDARIRALTVEPIRREVLPEKQPAIFRGMVRDWPAVREFSSRPASLVRYLKRLDSGAPVDALLTPPDIDGQIFYNEDMTGFNFHRNRLPLSEIAEQVLRYAQFARPPAVAAQSALIRDCLPGFAAENSLRLVDETILPRIWLGNRITTPAHVDEWNNIGCVVAGRRRFTLFPPEQISTSTSDPWISRRREPP